MADQKSNMYQFQEEGKTTLAIYDKITYNENEKIEQEGVIVPTATVPLYYPYLKYEMKWCYKVKKVNL